MLAATPRSGFPPNLRDCQRWQQMAPDTPAHYNVRRRTSGGEAMANANEDLVRQGYKAFGEGDMDTLRSLFAPDAVHVATGNNPLAGEYKGADAILGYYGKLFELSDGTFAAELETMKVESDDSVAATHRDKAKRGDKTLDQAETLTFTISGGKFTRIVENHSDQAAYDAFWS
jgi:ketosteroid isomerase-like protein